VSNHKNVKYRFRTHQFRVSIQLLITLCCLYQSAHSHSDITQSIERLTQEIMHDSDNAVLYFQRAELYRRQGKWSASENDFALAEQYGYNKQTLKFSQAQLLIDAGRSSAALPYLNELLRINPNFTKALILRAKIPERDTHDAISDLDRSIALLKLPSPDLYIDRAKLQIKSGSKFETMITGLTQGIDRLGPLASLVGYGVDQCESKGEFRQGLSMMNMLPTRIKEQANWQARYGKFYYNLRDTEKSRTHFLIALKAIEKLSASRRNSRAILKLKKEIQSFLQSSDYSQQNINQKDL